jgi:hypothetical protein
VASFSNIEGRLLIGPGNSLARASQNFRGVGNLDELQVAWHVRYFLPPSDSLG